MNTFSQSTVQVGNVSFDNTKPLVLIAGLNVLEDNDLYHQTALHCQSICQKLGISYVFKASFDKANRSSSKSYRGVGMQKGLAKLEKIKAMGIPVLTDVHEPHQAKAVSEVADILQLPAFLSRQSDLVEALAKTNSVINIKKAQFLAPQEMRWILEKFMEHSNDRLLLCERGSMFGYQNLVVDFLGFDIMKAMKAPLVFDVTHSLQKPGAGDFGASGRRAQAFSLAKSGIAQGIASLFLEMHPNPDEALCDGASALPMHLLEAFLTPLVAMDALVKSHQAPSIG